MSMWEFEAVFEHGATCIHARGWPPSERRAALSALTRMVSEYDIGFVHFRLLDELVADGFLHRIDAADHPGDEPLALPVDDDLWLTDEHGATAGLWVPESQGDHPPGIWFDCTMALWPRAVAAGLIEGVDSAHVDAWTDARLIGRLLEAALAAKRADDVVLFHGFAAMALEGVMPGDDDLQPVLDDPELATCLAAPTEDWIRERFDARIAASHGMNDPDFLAWWCAPYGRA